MQPFLKRKSTVRCSERDYQTRRVPATHGAGWQSAVGSIEDHWITDCETSGDGICRLGLRVATPEWWRRPAVAAVRRGRRFSSLARSL